MARWVRPRWRQRFLLGPLIALALVGADSATDPGGLTPTGGTPSQEPGASSGAAERFAHAKADLELALDAELVYFTDNTVYAATADGELTALKEIEPKIEWGTEVVVEVPSSSEEGSLVVILRAEIGVEGFLCLALVSEDQDTGPWYARVPVGSPCPPRSPGMPGWSGDEGTGWAA